MVKGVVVLVLLGVPLLVITALPQFLEFAGSAPPLGLLILIILILAFTGNLNF